MRYDHFSMLPERAFQKRATGGMTLEGGGGGSQTSTTYTSNVPEWLRPQTEALLGAATQEYFTTTPGTDPETGAPIQQITAIKPFTPYSTRPGDYVAGFSPIQQQAQFEAANMMRPGQYGVGSEYAGQAGMGGFESAGQAYGYGGMGAGYGGAGYGSGLTGQQLGITGGGRYGSMGAGYGSAAAGLTPEAQLYGQMAAGTGQRYESMATDPRAMQAYMSPYMQNVVDVQKQGAVQDYQEKILPQIQSQAVRAGAFGGSRDAVQRAMAQRSLGAQLQNIQATGTQKAFEDAQRAQQFGITSGLQGYQTGLQGLGQAGSLYGLGMQGAGLGLQGVQQQLAGTEQGMRGAGVGIQGAGLGLQGVQGAQAGYDLMGRSGVNLSNIGTAQQASDLARMQYQYQLGADQRAREQQIIDQAIQNYGMARDYPMEQLSKYSGLIRGYYTPSTTQTTYQASNPLAQAGGVLAQGIGAYGALGGGKKKGGSIKEKKYAEGGITDLNDEVINDPTSYSPEMIKKGMASGLISDMAGAIGLSGIKQAQQQAKQQQALATPAPRGTILGDLQQEQAGIPSLPTGLPPQGMAGGGIVAFDKGGLNDASAISSQNDFLDSIGLSGYEPEYTGQDAEGIDKLARGYLARRKAIPLGEAEIARKEALKKRPEELAQDRDFNRYLALMQFGSGLSSAKTRNLAEAIGQGTKAALPTLTESQRAYRAGMAETTREQAEIDRQARGEQLRALESAEAAYAKQQERKIAADAARSKQLEMDRYIARQMAAAKMDPRLKNVPPEVLEAQYARDFMNLRGALEARGTSASAAQRSAGAAESRVDLGVETAITAAKEAINKKYKTQILMAETDAQKKKLEAARDAEIEAEDARIRGKGSEPAPTTATATTQAKAPAKAAPNKPDISKVPNVPAGSSIGNFTDRGWEVKNKDGRVIGHIQS